MINNTLSFFSAAGDVLGANINQPVVNIARNRGNARFIEDLVSLHLIVSVTLWRYFVVQSSSPIYAPPVSSIRKSTLAAGLATATLLIAACRDTTTPPKSDPPVSTNATSSPAPSHSHTNRLAKEKSPYLRQHMHNPVDWYAWGPEAFAKARAENKPIFLSIGYSTCHWCHVMERESFENEAVAEYLNKNFVSIKVDREERPDVDKIYMTAVQ